MSALEVLKINNAKKAVSELNREIEVLKAKINRAQHTVAVQSALSPLKQTPSSLHQSAALPGLLMHQKEIDLYRQKLQMSHPTVAKDYAELVSLRERMGKYRSVLASTGVNMQLMGEMHSELVARSQQ